ncbi:hypothetical protein HRQ91_06655 [Treponema parvum]|uniref:Lipoprotein n=1 Tax=Treponema parvum TaxID=138851 RepID=A0A975IEK9_9SPIR|nr:hypothetical protein [Treponema parvum]QTQ14160.1 hypothetical protein HRQ91_06655 [Treponema parvum]
MKKNVRPALLFFVRLFFFISACISRNFTAPIFAASDTFSLSSGRSGSKASQTVGADRTGASVSAEIQKKLKLEGFNPKTINLISPGAGDFPYNILLTFEKKINKDGLETKGGQEESSYSVGASASSETSSYSKDFKTNVIFVFEQSDFLVNQGQIITLLKSISQKKYPFEVSILFPPNSSDFLGKGNLITGTDIFVDSIDLPDNTFAVSVKFSKDEYEIDAFKDGKRNNSSPSSKTAETYGDEVSVIMPGSKNEVSPLWLVKAISNSFLKNKAEYTVPAGTFLTVFRFGFLKGDPISDSFFREGIPSVSVTFADDLKLCPVLLSFLDNFKPEKTAEWDRHYLFFTFNGQNFVLNEAFLVRCYLAAAFVTLFFLCALSFFAGKKSLIHRSEIRKLWYLLPLTVIISIAVLVFGLPLTKLAASKLHLSPVMQLYIRIQLLFLALSAVFVIILKNRCSGYTYKFYITLSTIVNIFVFSAADLSLFFLFVFEYILSLLLRLSKRAIPFSIIGLLLFIPFIPYGIILWQYIEIQKISNLISGNILQNILLAFAVQPFSLVWLLILSQILNRNLKNKKTFQNRGIVFTAAAASFMIFLCFYGISHILEKYRFIPSVVDITDGVTLIRSKNNRLQVTAFDSFEFGNSVCNVEIRSSKPAERYEISISGKTVQPVYEATVPYTENTKDLSAAFHLPDFPPELCRITYTAAAIEETAVSVTSYYATDRAGTFECETCTAVISKADNEARTADSPENRYGKKTGLGNRT